MREAFAGSDYVPALDDTRLTTQIDRVRSAMSDGSWRTLREIAAITGDGEASISAQLRHLKRSCHGGYLVEKRPRGDRSHGLFEYAIVGKAEAGKLF